MYNVDRSILGYRRRYRFCTDLDQRNEHRMVSGHILTLSNRRGILINKIKQTSVIICAIFFLYPLENKSNLLAMSLLAGSMEATIEATARLWTINARPVFLADTRCCFKVVSTVVRASRKTLVNLLVDLVTSFTLPSSLAVTFTRNASAVTTASRIWTVACKPIPTLCYKSFFSPSGVD